MKNDTEQHQGEPVAMPDRKPWNGLLATADNLRGEGWNACLDEIAKLGPLYTHSDAGEVSLQQIMHAYEYAESHPHKYLRGTTNWCAAVAWHLNKNRVVQSGE